MRYTLGEAAKATGKSKPTIQRAIKSGKISAYKNENGAYEIEPSELHRIYEVKQGNTKDNHHMKQNVTHESNSMLQAEIDALRRELEQNQLERERERELMHQQIELYKDRLDRADQDKDRLASLLENHQSKGFWARFRK